MEHSEVGTRKPFDRCYLLVVSCAKLELCRTAAGRPSLSFISTSSISTAASFDNESQFAIFDAILLRGALLRSVRAFLSSTTEGEVRCGRAARTTGIVPTVASFPSWPVCPLYLSPPPAPPNTTSSSDCMHRTLPASSWIAFHCIPASENPRFHEAKPTSLYRSRSLRKAAHLGASSAFFIYASIMSWGMILYQTS